MKKLLLLTMLFTSPAYAGLIIHTDYTSGNTITASGQNANENTIVNEINGALDSANIENASILVEDLNAEVTAKFVPTGTVYFWVGSTNSIPSGYLYCNGQAVSRTTYAALFAVIGESFGEGNNSTTFNVPDMRGHFVRGMNDGSGNDPDAADRTAQTTGGNTGDNIGSVQTSTFTAHTHIQDSHTHSFSASEIIASTHRGGSSSSIRMDNITSQTTGGTVATNQNSGGNETRPININMAGIIKF